MAKTLIRLIACRWLKLANWKKWRTLFKSPVVILLLSRWWLDRIVYWNQKWPERIFQSKQWRVTLILTHECNVKFFQNSQQRFINILNINWIFIWATSTNFLLSDIHSRIAVVLGVFSAGCLYVVLSNIVETKWL